MPKFIVIRLWYLVNVAIFVQSQLHSSPTFIHLGALSQESHRKRSDKIPTLENSYTNLVLGEGEYIDFQVNHNLSIKRPKL